MTCKPPPPHLTMPISPHHDTHMRRLYTILSFLLLIAVAFALRAEISDENPLGIDPQCYQIYLSATNPSPDSDQAQLIDSLINTAKQVGDRKAEAVGAVLYCDYAVYHGDEHQLNLAFEQAMRLAREADYTEGIIKTYYNKAFYYLNTGQNLKSLYAGEEYLQYAEKANNPFALQEACYILGMAQLNLGEPQEAMGHLMRAIQQYPLTNRKDHLAEAYRILAKNTSEHTEEYYRKSLEMGTTHRDTTQIRYFTLMEYANRHDTASYIKQYNLITQDPTYPKGYEPSEQGIIEAYYYLLTNQKDKAVKAFDGKVYNEKFKANYLQNIYAYAEDWKNAYKSLIRYNDLKSQEERLQGRHMSAEYKENIEQEKLQKEISESKEAIEAARKEKARAEQENATAIARRHEAETKQQQLEAEHQRSLARAKTYQLEAEQQQREMEIIANQHLKAQTEAKILQEEKEASYNSIMTMFFVVGALLAFIATALIVYHLIQKRKKYAETTKINRQLQEARDDAVKTENIKNTFIHNMSLGIRMPLHTVLGMAQVLCDPTIETTDEEKFEYGESIMSNINVLIANIDDILNVSDIQSGNFSVTPTSNDIAAICNAAVAAATPHLAAGVQLEQKIDLPDNYHCVIDSRRAQQVLMTFLSNAAKHTVQGTIQLCATLNGLRADHLTLSVTNPTPITDPEIIAHLFDKREVQTHISLNLCESIANKMNGHVWYDQTYKDGARFCFDIPLNLKDAMQFD